MKKLMIMLVAVAATTVANAAAVQWASGAITDSTGAAITSAGVIKGYLYELTAADYATYSAMSAADLSKTIGGLYEAGKMPGTPDGSGENLYNKRTGAALDITGTIQHTAGTSTADAYGLILYVDEANKMYMANVASITVEGSADVKVSTLGSVLGGSDASRGPTSWQAAAAVPEPTSGLLLILGMAGLALRRKQK